MVVCHCSIQISTGTQNITVHNAMMAPAPEGALARHAAGLRELGGEARPEGRVARA